MYCENCGLALDASSLFCSSCGARVESTNSFTKHSVDFDSNKKISLHEKYQFEINELLSKGYSKLEVVPPMWDFLWKIGVDIKPPPLLSPAQIGLFCGGGFAFLFFITDLIKHYLSNGYIQSFGMYLFMGIAFGVLMMAVSWFRNQKLNGKSETSIPTNLPLNQHSKDKSFTLFGILDNGALKKKAIEERKYLEFFNPSYKLNNSEKENLNLLLELAQQIDKAIEKELLKGDFWSTNPINIDLLSISIEKEYFNNSMIDLNSIIEINNWLKSTLEGIIEVELIKVNLTSTIRLYQEEIKNINETYRIYINDETISKTDRSERLWEICSNILLKLFNKQAEIKNIDLIIKALQDSSLGETLEKFTREAFKSDPHFTYIVFRDNIYNKETAIDNMVLIDDGKLSRLLDYLNSYYANVLIFLEGNNLRASHCNTTMENSENADKDRIISINISIFIVIFLSSFIGDTDKAFGSIVVWGVMLVGFAFYFINKNNSYKCTECNSYKTVVLAKKDFQGSYSYSYDTTERDRMTNSKGELTGHIERRVTKRKEVNKYDIATYCLACNSIHFDRIEEE